MGWSSYTLEEDVPFWLVATPIFFIFTLTLGRWTQFDLRIFFQMGLFNHRLGYLEGNFSPDSITMGAKRPTGFEMSTSSRRLHVIPPVVW